MSARDTVLGKIRRSLGVTGEEPRRNATVDDRLSRPVKGVIPARAQVPPGDQVALFIKLAEKAAATVDRIADEAAIPEAVAQFLRAHNLPAALRMGDDPMLNSLSWQRTSIAVTRGATNGSDTVGLSHAHGAVAETGTLVLVSGTANPTTINFLPETHIIVVKSTDVVGDMEAIWPRLRAEYGKGAMPRTVNMVTGPSRSGDIEQQLLLGAHGPRRLHIVVVG